MPTLGGATGGAHRVRQPAATAHNLDSSKIVAPRAVSGWRCTSATIAHELRHGR